MIRNCYLFLVMFIIATSSNGQHASVQNSVVGASTNTLIRNGSGSGNTIDSIGDPSVFGDNVWNVYAWNSTGVDSWNLNYAGYYTDSVLSMNTTNVWADDRSPSYAPNYLGDPVSDDNHSFAAKRRGFPTAYYSINIPGHDDYAYLLIDGVEVWNHEDCCDYHEDVWRGILTDTSTIEFRIMEFGGGSYGFIEFVPLPFTITIASTNIVCHGGTSQVTVSATGGVPPYIGTGTFAEVAGTYVYTVSDNTGETTDRTFEIIEPPLVDSSISFSTNNVLCNGDIVELTGPEYGSSLSFEGAPNRVLIPINSPETNYTFELDFKTTVLNGGISSVRDGDLGGTFDRELYLAGGDIFHRLYSEETIGSYGQNYADNQWHHVAVVVEEFVGQSIYVDGLLVAQGSMDHSDFNWDSMLHLGFADDWFVGSIDNVRMWDVVRTPSEIQQDQTANIVGAVPNLIGNWKFDYTINNVATNAADNSPCYVIGGALLESNNTNSYLWSNGETSRTVALTTSQDISVNITTAEGCMSTSELVSLAFNPTPAVPTTSTTSSLTFCDGGNAELTASPESEYQWKKNGVDIGGETGQTISAISGGDYSVTVTNIFGCTSSSANTTVDVMPAPPIPTITASSTTTFCDGGTVQLIGQTGNVNVRYVSTVLNFSSEYSYDGWGSIQLLGAPDAYIPYGDIPSSWAPSNPDEPREFLELGFQNPIPINFIDIYETYNPGTIDTVYVKNPDSGLFEMVYSSTAAPAGDTARILHITFPMTAFDVSEIRISMDMSAVPDWNELDAVQIGNDLPATYEWSNGVTTNSIVATTSGNYTLTVENSIGCTTTSDAIVVTVNPTPTVFAGSDFTVGGCAGNIQLTSGTPSGGIYTGVPVQNNEFDASFGSGTYTVYYNYEDANGCINYDDVSITVQDLPTAALATFANVCSDANSFALTGGTPSGGTFSGPGVTNGIFDPSIGQGSYSITYQVDDSSGCSATASQNLLVDVCAGLNSELSQSNVSIYPNPATNFIQVSYSSEMSKLKMIEIYNSAGQMVFVKTLKENKSLYNSEIQVSDLTQGVYFLKFVTEGGSFNKKLVIQ